MKTFELEIITPEQKVFQGTTNSLIVPAEKGYLGIMAGHAPFICLLNEGKITIRNDKNDLSFQISKGFIEATPHKTTILANNIKKL
jgi:F-type H+-transporting ATPase subunit epsilon